MIAMARPAPRTLALAAVALVAVGGLAISSLVSTGEAPSETPGDAPTAAVRPAPGAGKIRVQVARNAFETVLGRADLGVQWHLTRQAGDRLLPGPRWMDQPAADRSAFGAGVNGRPTDRQAAGASPSSRLT